MTKKNLLSNMNLGFVFRHALPDGKCNLGDWQWHVSRGFAHQVIHAATPVNALKKMSHFDMHIILILKIS